jgi:IS30 family transposase
LGFDRFGCSCALVRLYWLAGAIMNSHDILLERYFDDSLKKELDKFERAFMIRDYLERNNISVRSFAKKRNIPKSTIDDWLLYNRITEEHYQKLISEGKNHKEIYKALRRNKKEEFVYSDLDAFLTDIRPKLKQFRQKGDVTPKTLELIDELVNELNSLSVDLRLKMKKVKS